VSMPSQRCIPQLDRSDMLGSGKCSTIESRKAVSFLFALTL
jgi:hypothetical protein